MSGLAAPTAAAPPAARGRSTRILAWTLGLVAAAATVDATLLRHLRVPGRAPGGAFGEAHAADARALLTRLLGGLLRMQDARGLFDPYADDPGQPEVRRTASHVLAAYALARARRAGVTEADVPGLDAGLDRALDHLAGIQVPGGGFGAMPQGIRNPWPGVDATSGALLAFLEAGRPGDRNVMQGAAQALARASTYKLRDGWTRAVAAIAVDALAAAGRSGLLGAAPEALVRWDPSSDRVDCTDYRLAEAIARRVLRRDPAQPEAVVSACLADPPVWSGDSSDLQSWWLQSWLAARSPGRAGPWYQGLLPVLGEAEAAAPAGRIPSGWYADGVAQTACACLCLAEGLLAGPP